MSGHCQSARWGTSSMLAAALGLGLGLARAETPGQRFNLSGWELQTCLTTPRAVDSPALRNYSDQNFFLGKDGSMVLITPDNSSAITTHADHPRTELRETGVADWNFNSSDVRHSLMATCVVDSVSPTNGETIVAQIHGSVDEEKAKILKLRWTKGLMEARVKNSSFGEIGLSCGHYEIGQTLNYTVVVEDSSVTVTVNGNICGGSSYKPPYNTADRYYFKAGDYNQCKPCAGSSGKGQVRLLALATEHALRKHGPSVGEMKI